MKKTSICISAALIAASAYVLSVALTYPKGTNGVPGPGAFPIALSAIMIVLAVLNIVVELNTNLAVSEKAPPKQDIIRVCIAGGITIAYFAAIIGLGFVLATPLYLFVIMKYFKVKRWLILIGIPIVITTLLYIIFSVLLLVPLPSGPWG